MSSCGMRSGICSSSFLHCSCAINAVVYKNVHYGCCCCCFIMEPNALMVRSAALKDYTGVFFLSIFCASLPTISLPLSLSLPGSHYCFHFMSPWHEHSVGRSRGLGGVISVTTESLDLFLCEELEALNSSGLSLCTLRTKI